MKIVNTILILLVLSCNTVELSEMQLNLKANAIPINKLSNLDTDIYEAISNYEIIMIGEMHGTNEPAEFAYGLCKLIAQQEENVILGMEISPGQMDGFSETMSIEQLKKLPFFNGENLSGMNGEAWLNLIDRSNQNNKIITKFFDYQRVAPRDSSMYNAICDIRKTHPNTKIVTLSGNLHNRIKPFRDNKMLGVYLVNDTINFDSNKIMSLMHFYNEGTMLNNIGNGLELTTIEGKENIFNKTLSTDKFFCKKINPLRDDYTHFFYTNKVSHSKVIENKD